MPPPPQHPKSPNLDPPPPPPPLIAPLGPPPQPTLPEPPPPAPPIPPHSPSLNPPLRCPPPPPPPPQGASGQHLVGGVVGVQNRGVAPPVGGETGDNTGHAEKRGKTRRRCNFGRLLWEESMAHGMHRSMWCCNYCITTDCFAPFTR